MQCTTPEFKMNATPQCSSWCRDGNRSFTTRYNTDAVEYEQNLSNPPSMVAYFSIIKVISYSTLKITSNSQVGVCMKYWRVRNGGSIWTRKQKHKKDQKFIQEENLDENHCASTQPMF